MTQRAEVLEISVATPADMDDVRRINHATFADEIPQHEPRPDGRLIDRFEADSLFVVARSGGRLVGMLAMRAERPFSLDAKIADLDSYLPRGCRPCEVRLLAVDRAHRNGVVLRGLLERLVHECDARGLNLAVLSATTRQLDLYAHLGCVPFGPLVGTAIAAFQPMFVTREAIVASIGTLLRRPAALRTPPRPHRADAPACFLTGPVALSDRVRQRLSDPLVAHRGPRFATDLAAIRSAIAALLGARHVAVLTGSGTLANDAVAAQLKSIGGRGIVISNGEFGDRLAMHASSAGLEHLVLRRPWGSPVDSDDLERAALRAGAAWIWGVHCETSTGMLNDLASWRTIAARCGARLAIDAASSAGTVPIDLSGIALATTVSGKALGAVAGLAIVCLDAAPLPPAPGTPRCLDLAPYVGTEGVPFTMSSLLVGALAEAVTTTDWPARYAAIAAADAELRLLMRRTGHRPVVGGRLRSPAVCTWITRPGTDAAAAAAVLERRGFLVSWQSGYLRTRGWLQTALMGDFRRDVIADLADALATALSGGGAADRPSLRVAAGG